MSICSSSCFICETVVKRLIAALYELLLIVFLTCFFDLVLGGTFLSKGNVLCNSSGEQYRFLAHEPDLQR